MLTINITDIQIVDWLVDLVRLCVVARYKMVTDTGDVYQLRTAWFWVTLPDNPSSDDYLLGEEYVNILADLTNDARLALLPLIGEIN